MNLRTLTCLVAISALAYAHKDPPGSTPAAPILVPDEDPGLRWGPIRGEIEGLHEQHLAPFRGGSFPYAEWLAGARALLDKVQGDSFLAAQTVDGLLDSLVHHYGRLLDLGMGPAEENRLLGELLEAQRAFYVSLSERGFPRFYPSLTQRLFDLGNASLAASGPLVPGPGPEPLAWKNHVAFYLTLETLHQLGALPESDLLLASLLDRPSLHTYLNDPVRMPLFFRGPDQGDARQDGTPPLFPSHEHAMRLFHALRLGQADGPEGEVRLAWALRETGAASPQDASAIQALALKSPAESPLVFFVADPRILHWGFTHLPDEDFRNAFHLTDAILPSLLHVLACSRQVPPAPRDPIALLLIRMAGQDALSTVYVRREMRERIQAHFAALEGRAGTPEGAALLRDWGSRLESILNEMELEFLLPRVPGPPGTGPLPVNPMPLPSTSPISVRASKPAPRPDPETEALMERIRSRKVLHIEQVARVIRALCRDRFLTRQELSRVLRHHPGQLKPILLDMIKSGELETRNRNLGDAARRQAYRTIRG